jgi:RHS repeat-associated protein
MGRIAQQTPGGLQYFLPDALGSARQLTGAAGALALAQSFDPYGGLLASQGSAATPYGFAGEWGDDASGLIYLRARYYAPVQGRFTTRDIILGSLKQPSAQNPYIYGFDNPQSYVDPSGHFPWIPFLIIGAGAAFIAGSVVYDIATVEPITAPRAPYPTSSDLTCWLVDRINENTSAPVTEALRGYFTSRNPIQWAGAMKAWVGLVRTGAVWDYKVDIKQANLPDNITLAGQEYNFQAVANIYFGAMGRNVGIPLWILEGGAGSFQIRDNWNAPNTIGSASTFFDDPYDNWMIKFGSWLYDNYGTKFSKMTPEDFTGAMKQYEMKYGSPGEPLR